VTVIVRGFGRFAAWRLSWRTVAVTAASPGC
jgi:hypothetical protein